MFDRLISAYRESPGNVEHARRFAGCGRDLAQRAWVRGWPHFRGGLSIQLVFQDEQRKARAQLLAEQAARSAMADREREDAHKQAVEARKQEGQMVNLARGGSLQGLTIVGQLVAGGRVMAAKVKKLLDEEAAKPDTIPDPIHAGVTIPNPYRMNMTDQLVILGRIASISRQLVDMAQQSMEMERLHLGEPAHIIGIRDLSDDMSLEEADLRLQAAHQAINEAQRAHGFHVVQGGASFADEG